MNRMSNWRSMCTASRRRHDAGAVTKLTKVAVFAMLAISLAGCIDPKRRQEDLNPGFNPYYYGAVVPREDKPPHKWTKFLAVAGQPEPVPAEWVATPEGQYAHSIVLPDPLPKDSGYRWTMSATDYFLHLCEKEAGEFVYRKAIGVRGFFFARPPLVPDDRTVADRYLLEAPMFEAQYQNLGYTASERGREFVAPPFRTFEYMEEPAADGGLGVVPVKDYKDTPPRLTTVEVRDEAESKYMVTWRGIRRERDRAHGIAGSELIVLDRGTGEVLGVLREYGVSGRRGPVYWLNAARCPKLAAKSPRPEIEQSFRFLSSVLQPVTPPLKGRRFNERP